MCNKTWTLYGSLISVEYKSPLMWLKQISNSTYRSQITLHKMPWVKKIAGQWKFQYTVSYYHAWNFHQSIYHITLIASYWFLPNLMCTSHGYAHFVYLSIISPLMLFLFHCSVNTVFLQGQRGIGSGPSWMPKIHGCSNALHKMVQYWHINFAHPPIYFKAYIDYL